MSTNSRIRDVLPGATVERIAVETHVFYDPTTQSARIVFQGEEFMLDGALPVAALQGRESLEVDLADIVDMTFAADDDPVTGAKLDQVSTAGIGNLIRAVYDALHNLRAGGDQ